MSALSQVDRQRLELAVLVGSREDAVRRDAVRALMHDEVARTSTSMKRRRHHRRAAVRIAGRVLAEPEMPRKARS